MEIVWLSTKIDADETSIYLRHHFPYSKLFSDANECVDYMISAGYMDKIIFVIADPFYFKGVIPTIYEFNQINSIYILCRNVEDYILFPNLCEKIKGTFLDQQRLDFILHTHLSNSVQQTKVFVRNPSIREITIEKGSFLWFQYLITILLRMPELPNDKTEMLTICRLIYKDNKSIQEKINEFDQIYTKDEALSWYTKDSFVYRTLNGALRTENFDYIFNFRFFIRDLHKQLQELARQEKQGQTGMLLYRGQQMSHSELQCIKNNIHQLISMNTFVSTSTDRCLARTFASAEPPWQSILFEIEIPENTDGGIYVNIERYSQYSNENEYLISIGAVFKIKSVEQEEDGIVWLIKLVLTSITNGESKQVIDYFEKNLKSRTSLIDIIDLLFETGDYNRVVHYSNKFLQMSSSDVDCEGISHVYCVKGNACIKLELYYQAIDCYQQVLALSSHQNTGNVAIAYSSLGYIHECLEKNQLASAYYSQALDTYSAEDHGVNKNALHITNKKWILGKNSTNVDYDRELQETKSELLFIDPINKPLLAHQYNRIGMIHSWKKQHQMAIEYFELAVQCGRDSLPYTHPEFAIWYYNLAGEYKNLEDFTTARENYLKALAIELNREYPRFHFIALLYNSVGQSYGNNYDDISAAARNDQKSNYITRYFCPEADNNLMSSNYRNTALRCFNMEQYSLALRGFERALGTLMMASTKTLQSVAELHRLIGAVHFHIEDYQLALQSYFTALQIASRDLDDDGSEQALWCAEVGAIFIKLESFLDAERWLKLAIEFHLDLTSPDITRTNIFYQDLGHVYMKLNQYENAIKTYEEVAQYGLPVDYERLVIAYAQLLVSEARLENITKIMAYFGKVFGLKCDFLTASTSYTVCAIVFEGVGDFYYEERCYELAIKYHRRAIKIGLKYAHFNTVIGRWFGKLGLDYEMNGNLDQALEAYLKVLDYSLILPVKTCDKLIRIYKKKQDHEKMNYYEELRLKCSSAKIETMEKRIITKEQYLKWAVDHATNLIQIDRLKSSKIIIR